jgi:hypothetical protein
MMSLTRRNVLDAAVAPTLLRGAAAGPGKAVARREPPYGGIATSALPFRRSRRLRSAISASGRVRVGAEPLPWPEDSAHAECGSRAEVPHRHLPHGVLRRNRRAPHAAYEAVRGRTADGADDKSSARTGLERPYALLRQIHHVALLLGSDEYLPWEFPPASGALVSGFLSGNAVSGEVLLYDGSVTGEPGRVMAYQRAFLDEHLLMGVHRFGSGYGNWVVRKASLERAARRCTRGIPARAHFRLGRERAEDYR